MKHKRKDRPVKKNLAIPESVADRVDEQLRDPFTQRPAFGAWASLVTQLLTKWLNGEITVTVKLKKPAPFCHLCLLDRNLYHTCNNPECPVRKPNDINPIPKVQERTTPSVPVSKHD